MNKIEKEIKVLDINKKEIINKLNSLGAKYVEETTQKIYVYDIPSIYSRFLEIKQLILNIDNIMKEVSKEKFILLANEVFDLFSNQQEEEFLKILKITDVSKLENIEISNLKKILQNKKLDNLLSDFLINENKWIRLRQTNDKTTLTIKHIINKKNNNFQYVKECEIKVNDLLEANELLNQLAIFSRNYQEKIRTSYTYKDAEIEIDEWPDLKPYLEIECDNEKTIKEIISNLDLGKNKIVSVNTNELYKEIGIDILKVKNLSFNKK